MRTYKTIFLKKATLAVFILFINFSVQAQEFILNNQESQLKIYGTSSLHDWHEDAEKQSGKIKFENLESGKIETLAIEVDAESLKSGKTAMDKNTYKALKTNDFKKIKFQLTSVKSLTSKGQGVYAVNAMGDLTVAGTKNNIPIDFNLSIKDGKVTIVGEKKIKMTDYKVDPPKALFGTITTGDDLTIKFTTIFK
ncbi:YceI family protein [Siansivirga zeaxanthinifaciens]|uniref:Lipid/polyisoprenoid-binding YceI-like domain-containing protein n=1 Tax=Siansivirga zeaxanthinifaciens CC-SAMT-1 TaxID=1454006 RepID=A0A0C5VXA7_9FLAO|nr:YceI family protein [Siansivirga zeaxanthinifaciens]AJR03736.1 hypothetical protein AW14_09000 [Siansivirga zeaxanthinifaciens CC-SAMT-1]